MANLYLYQQEAVGWLRQHDRAMLCLDTGLGKTAVAIRAAVESGVSRVLVICPAFLRLNWSNEVERWSDKKCKVIKSLKDVNAWDTEMFGVASYDFASTKGRAEALAKAGIDILVCDESHYLRNWAAARTKQVVFSVACKSAKCWFLTATPIVKGAGDLHPVLSAIKPGAYGKYTDFCKVYCEKKWNPFVRNGYSKGDWQYVGIREDTKDGLKKILDTVAYVKSKAEVLSDLPERRQVSVYLDADTKLSEKVDPQDVYEAVLAGNSTDSFASVRRELGISKIAVAAEYVGSMTGQTVVFAHHIDVVTGLAEALEKQDKTVGIIIGGQSEADRMDVVRAFEAGEIEIVVASMGAAGVGITLNAAEQCVFVELPWTYTELKQCEDRIGRIGSTHKSVCSYRVMSSDFDYAVERALEGRKNMASDVGLVV